jgi:hypothetical protein
MNKAKLSFALPERLENESDLSEEQLQSIRTLAAEVEAEGMDFDMIATFGERQATALIDRLTEIRDGKDSDQLIIENDHKPSNGKVVGWIIALAIIIALIWLVLG